MYIPSGPWHQRVTIGISCHNMIGTMADMVCIYHQRYLSSPKESPEVLPGPTCQWKYVNIGWSSYIFQHFAWGFHGFPSLPRLIPSGFPSSFTDHVSHVFHGKPQLLVQGVPSTTAPARVGIWWNAPWSPMEVQRCPRRYAAAAWKMMDWKKRHKNEKSQVICYMTMNLNMIFNMIWYDMMYIYICVGLYCIVLSKEV